MTKEIWKLSLGLMLGLGTCLSAGSVEAQTACTVPPSCSALGYDKTSSDCTGQPMLKCPFDQSKVYCAGMAGVGTGNYATGTCNGMCVKDENGSLWKISETVLRGKHGDQIQACRDLKEGGRVWVPVKYGYRVNDGEYVRYETVGNFLASVTKESTWVGLIESSSSYYYIENYGMISVYNVKDRDIVRNIHCMSGYIQ